MHNFEQVRGHLAASGYRISMQEPYVVCVELSLDGGKRHQAIFLSELQDDDERAYLRASTVIAPTTGIDGKRALAFNWESRVGYLAIGELDGVPPAAVREPPYDGLDAAEIDRPSSRSAAWATASNTCSRRAGSALKLSSQRKLGSIWIYVRSRLKAQDRNRLDRHSSVRSGRL